MRLTIKVPLNAVVVVDANVRHYVDNFSMYDCQSANHKSDTDPATFIMTETGLQCRIDSLGTVAPPVNANITVKDTAAKELQVDSAIIAAPKKK